MKRVAVLVGLCAAFAVPAAWAAAPADPIDYRVLATNRTSTMEKEMNAAADAGFQFGGTMGGQTTFGGSEVLVVMWRDTSSPAKPRFQYKLLATSRTSTMQKEMQDAGDAGFDYCGQTVFTSTFGGKEVVVILERDSAAAKRPRYEYRLLATTRTSTMQKELGEAGQAGFGFVGLTVGSTAVGGTEVVSILRRAVK
jgi:hypothetical protein